MSSPRIRSPARDAALEHGPDVVDLQVGPGQPLEKRYRAWSADPRQPGPVVLEAFLFDKVRFIRLSQA